MPFRMRLFPLLAPYLLADQNQDDLEGLEENQVRGHFLSLSRFVKKTKATFERNLDFLNKFV